MNNLDEDITGKVVVIREDVMLPEFRAVGHRLFRAEGGFGCSPNTNGRAVFGVLLASGEKGRMDGTDFERYATDEEIAAVTNREDRP